MRSQKMDVVEQSMQNSPLPAVNFCQETLLPEKKTFEIRTDKELCIEYIIAKKLQLYVVDPASIILGSVKTGDITTFV